MYEPDALQEKLSIRSALYRYLFVRGELNDISSLISAVNRNSADRMFFLKNDQNRKATIKQSDMDKLIALCSEGEYTLDLPLSAKDLKAGNEIPLPDTLFENGNATYKIVDVVRKKNGTYKVQLELNLFNLSFLMTRVSARLSLQPRRNWLTSSAGESMTSKPTPPRPKTRGR